MCVFFPASRLLWKSTSKKVEKVQTHMLLYSAHQATDIKRSARRRKKGDVTMRVCLCGFMIVCGNNFQCHRGGFPLCEVCICLFVCVRILSVESESLFCLCITPTHKHTNSSAGICTVWLLFERERENTGLISYINVNNKWPISLNKGVTSVKMAETLFP